MKKIDPWTRSARALVSLGLVNLALLAGGPSAAHAQGPGDLLVAPTRLVFEGRDRTAEISLVNTGTATATYRISFVELRMSDEGGTQEIEETETMPGEHPAAPMIRYSPRQVTLSPLGVQSVRLQLRKPEGLEHGEYRSHLLFRAVPLAEPFAPAGQAALAGQSSPAGQDPAGKTEAVLSVDLKPIFGISIPVIVRHGETAAKVSLSQLALVPAAGEVLPVLRVELVRSGNQSVYGNLTATIVPAQGKPSVIGQANGIAIYTPNALRQVSIPLSLPPDVELEDGVLHLAYTRPNGDFEIIAEADLPLPLQ